MNILHPRAVLLDSDGTIYYREAYLAEDRCMTINRALIAKVGFLLLSLG